MLIVGFHELHSNINYNLMFKTHKIISLYFIVSNIVHDKPSFPQTIKAALYEYINLLPFYHQIFHYTVKKLIY